jgi:Flp pilus assembly pilin Flp
MRKKICGALGRLRGDATGTTAIEYALIAIFIGLVLLSLQTSIGASVCGFFESVGTNL